MDRQQELVLSFHHDSLAQGLNLSPQTWGQVPLFTEPLARPTLPDFNNGQIKLNKTPEGLRGETGAAM